MYMCLFFFLQYQLHLYSLSTWHQGVAFLQQSISHGLGIQQNLGDVLFEHGSGSLQRQKWCCVTRKTISGHSRWLVWFIHELLKLSWCWKRSAECSPKGFSLSFAFVDYCWILMINVDIWTCLRATATPAMAWLWGPPWSDGNTAKFTLSWRS